MSITPEQKVARIKKLVSSPRALLSGQVGITVGSFEISNKLSSLKGTDVLEYPIFSNYRASLPLDMPVGTERLYWEHKALLKSDRVLAKIEYKYRPQILETCSKIIKEYDSNTNLDYIKKATQ